MEGEMGRGNWRGQVTCFSLPSFGRLHFFTLIPV